MTWVILADVRAGEHVVAESNDVGAVATIILFAEIEDLRLKSFDELTDTRRIGATKLVAVRSAHRRLRNLKTFHFHLSYKVIGGPQLLEHRLNFSFRIKAESSKSVQEPQAT